MREPTIPGSALRDAAGTPLERIFGIFSSGSRLETCPPVHNARSSDGGVLPGIQRHVRVGHPGA